MPDAPAPHRFTILLADDEPAVRSYLGSLLRRQGYQVLQAVDGADALDVAAQHPGPIHLLLTDIDMPRLDGCELHHRLRRQRPETRTLFISGSVDLGVQPDAAFLPKPLDPPVLVRKVREMLQAKANGARC